MIDINISIFRSNERLTQAKNVIQLAKNISSNIDRSLIPDREINYFTPLVHHLIQKHIAQYGKDFPMYFAGYNITKLTQGNDRTALIYAGKDEVEFTKEQADAIKKRAACAGVTCAGSSFCM